MCDVCGSDCCSDEGLWKCVVWMWNCANGIGAGKGLYCRYRVVVRGLLGVFDGEGIVGDLMKESLGLWFRW